MTAAENPKAVTGDNSYKFGKEQLKAYVERIERLAEEKKTIADDIRDVFAEAKGAGYDVKALRGAIRLRAKDPKEVQEEQAILETYCAALGLNVFG